MSHFFRNMYTAFAARLSLHPKHTPRSTMSSHTNIAKVGVAAAQVKPATQKYSAFQGPAYGEATRSSLAGLYKPAAGNQRPFVNGTDEFRSTQGMFTWDPASPNTRGPSHGGQWKHTLFGNERIRAAKTLHTTQHDNLHFLGNYPGKAPSNPFALEGKRVLSDKFVPVELKGTALLFVHPSSSEMLQYTQEGLREDAKRDGRDLDNELTDEVERLQSQSPVQPYHDIVSMRRTIHAKAREQIIEQEMRLHRRRIEKGLPVPPIMMPQYSHEYPDTPEGKPKVLKELAWWMSIGGWKRDQKMGTIHVGKLPTAHLNRMRARTEQYEAELVAQGFERGEDPWAIAEKRAMAKFGSAPLEAEVVEPGTEEDILFE